MELCRTLDMIGDHLTNALQGFQLCRFCNVIIGIHEDDITSYIASGRSLFDK